MTKNRKIAIAFVIAIFVCLGFVIAYIFAELYTASDISETQLETTDAMKFKKEYEDLNGKTDESNNTYRSLSISENNPIVYATASTIVNMIDKDETFIVYFGYAKDAWSRSIIETLINSAQEKNISTIYYVDIENIRDIYTLNDNHEAVRTTEGTDGYYDLLNKLNSVLDNYGSLSYDTVVKKHTVSVDVPINEKRIFAPNIILIKNGEPKILATGISSLQTDGFMDLTTEMINDTKKQFESLYSGYFETTTTTTTSTTTTSSNVCTKDGC